MTVIDLELWAAANVEFTDRESAFPGYYDPDRSPHLSEVLRALGPCDSCRIVTVKASAQVGKSTIARIFMLANIVGDPCDFLYTHPTLDSARRWSKLKLSPFLSRLNVPLAADRILFKRRKDGLASIKVAGATAPSSLEGSTVRCQVQDDLSKWVDNRQGDPEARADTLSFLATPSKILKTSTPLVLPECRITRSFERGSQERFYVPCPHCGTMQTFEFENFFPRGEAFLCVSNACRGFIEDGDRRRILPRGEWRAMNPNAAPEHRSFEIWSAYNLAVSFEFIARQYHEARGDTLRQRCFANDVLGRAWPLVG